MSASNSFISCDWGTSNFRLRLVNIHSLEVLAELQTDMGVKPLYLTYQQQGQASQTDYFMDYLQSQVLKLVDHESKHAIVISGMASSNIGLLEMEYADLPLDFGGAGLKWKSIPNQHGNKTILISGVKDESSMMRGEEVQAIGLVKYFESERGTLILPGTHSKHLVFDHEQFNHMKTFMTGELFEILSNHSILNASLEAGTWEQSVEREFLRGVYLGSEQGISSNLFSVRANHVLNRSDKVRNFYYLSGLLIGGEIAYLKGYQDKIYLAAPEDIGELYILALKSMIDSNQLVRLPSDKLVQAIISGHQKILSSYVS